MKCDYIYCTINKIDKGIAIDVDITEKQIKRDMIKGNITLRLKRIKK